MKLILSLGLLLIATYVQSASIVRENRNTEGIIPTIVEEILKVELQSDLKKNSDVEVPAVLVPEMPVVAEEVPVFKKIVDEPTVVVTEEKIITDDGVKETIVDVKKTETIVPVVVEKVDEIPAGRNVVKEEIPQVEELRKVPVVPEEVPAVVAVPEKPAVVDIIPEPVQASVQAAPEIEVEQPKLKTEIIPEVVKTVEEVKKIDVVIPVEIKKIEVTPDQQIEKIEEKVVVVETVVPEVKKIVEDVKTVEVPVVVEPVVAPVVVDETIPESKQDAPNRPQQILNQLQAVVGSIFNRNNVSAVANDETVGDEAASPTTSTSRPILQAIQGLGTSIQTAGQTALNNVVNSVQSTLGINNNAAQSDGTTASAGPIQSVIQSVTGAVSNLQSSFGTLVQNTLTGQSTNTAQAPAAAVAPAVEAADVPQKVVAVDNKIDEPAAAAKEVPVEMPQDVVVAEEPKKDVVVPSDVQPIVEVKKTEPEHPVV